MVLVVFGLSYATAYGETLTIAHVSHLLGYHISAALSAHMQPLA